MKKVYVRVTSDFDATGYMQPKSIIWTNGKVFPIEGIRDFRPADIVRIVKGNTSRVLLSEFSDILRSPTVWTRSYFGSTAGNVSSETIRRYLETQKTR